MLCSFRSLVLLLLLRSSSNVPLLESYDGVYNNTVLIFVCEAPLADAYVVALRSREKLVISLFVLVVVRRGLGEEKSLWVSSLSTRKGRFHTRRLVGLFLSELKNPVRSPPPPQTTTVLETR